MGRKIKVTVTLSVVVDEDTWITEYGMPRGEALANVGEFLPAYVGSLVGGSACDLRYLMESVTLHKPVIKVEPRPGVWARADQGMATRRRHEAERKAWGQPE